MSNLSSYIMFEVLETSWGRLMDGFRNASDLDALQRAHDEYLHDIQSVFFLPCSLSGPDGGCCLYVRELFFLPAT